MRHRRHSWILFLVFLCMPAWAQQSGSSRLGPKGWGLRAGVADGPDQVVGGAHVNLGEIVPRLRFRPSIELGLGDDHTTLFVTAPVHYRFDVDGSVVPYAGGGLAVGLVDHDRPGNAGDESDLEIALRAIGGVEWRLNSGREFFVELNIGLGDVHDTQVLVGWMF